MSGSSLNEAELTAIRRAALEPRPMGRRLESRETATRRGRVEIALCSLVLEAGLRCEQAAGLAWRDLGLDSDTRPTITVRTEPDEAGDVVGISSRAFDDLHAIAPEDADLDERVFELDAGQVASRIRAAARAAGLESRIADTPLRQGAHAEVNPIGPRTARAHAYDWRAFCAWCDERDAETLPARPETVAEYLREASVTSSHSAVRGKLRAISHVHRESRLADPCASKLVGTAMADISELSSGFTPASIDSEALEAVRATAMTPRRYRDGREPDHTARTRGLVDIALCSVLYAADLTAEQAAALRWSDVEKLGEDRANLTVASRTDPPGSTEIREIAGEAVHDLDAIRGDAPPENRVFGLSWTAVYSRVKEAARNARLGV